MASREIPAGTAGFQIYSLEAHARSKGMWCGTLTKAAIPDLYGVSPAPADAPEGTPPYRLAAIKNEHTPALLKIIDEGLVNASDHKKEHEGARAAADRVTRISLDFDRASGRVVIENDGPGIPILVHEGASAALGRDVYVPEVAFSIFLAGRNMEKPPDCVKGGINGVGGKLMNVHSASFAVETVSEGSFYVQHFGDRMRARAPPKIFSVRSAEAAEWGRKHHLEPEWRRPHTRIVFVPAYAELGYALGPAGGPAPLDAEDLEAWCRWRMFLLAAYVGPKVVTSFNGVRCPTTSARDIAALAAAHDPGAIVMSLTAKAAEPPCSAHPWDVAVAILPSARRFGQLSVINGVNCAKGAHTTYLKKLLNEAVGAKLARATKARDKKTSVADTCRQVFLVVVGALPGADWGGQRKDELQVSEAKLRPYSFATIPLGRVATAVADQLLRGAERGVRATKKKIEAEKYTGARRAGTKDAAGCRLLMAEGDSAISLLRGVLTLGKKNPGGPSFETHGIVSLGGVIMNAMKKVSEVETAGGETLVVRSEQLRNNKVLKALVEVLGLDFTCSYEDPAERARLRYGGVVICTDQDLDGTGKILCLVLVWFHLFWPALILAGFVKRLMTPVIRAYPKGERRGEPAEFAYENEFARWAAALGGEGAVLRSHNVKYYKGLGSHDDDEVLRIARAFEASVYTFTLDDSAAELFEVYFGTRPALRKAALSTPVAFLSLEEAQAVHAARRIPCSVQLRVDAKAYKLDDIQRKIPGLDGIPVARRKVLAGALRRFASSNHEVKVFQLGGYVAEHMFYHHGDASLNGTIVGMAQRFPGALHYPYLVGIGQFGTRHLGGDDAASARYISVRLAAPYARAMFPAEDTWLLPHVFEDGERAQPRFFVPVLPAALLESFDIPSEGWRHKSFARDFGQVVALVRALVAGDPLAAQAAAAAEAGGLASLPPAALAAFRARFPLDVALAGYGEHLEPGERAELVRPFRGYLHSFGHYRPEHPPSGSSKGTLVRVSELPIGVSTEGFLRSLLKGGRADLIADVADESSGARVDVAIRLAPGAWETICGEYGGADIDPLEDFLLLRASLKPFLNYYGPRGGVLEFGDDYHALLLCWVPLRRGLYAARLRREAVLLRLRAALEDRTIEYIGLGVDLAKEVDEDAAAAALATRGFPMFDSCLLANPRYTPVAEIEHLVLRGGGVSYAYLLDLRERELVAAAKAKRVARAAQLRRRLAEVEGLLAESPFPGASVWAREIEAVVAAVALGEKTRWRF